MLGRIDMKKHMNTITTLLALSASVIIFGCEPKGDTSTEVKAPAETPATVAAKPEAKATEEKPKAPKATDATAKPSLLPAAPEDKLRKGEKTNAAATPKIPASLSSSKANKTNKLNQQPTEPVALKDQVIVAIPETLDLGTFSTSEKGSGSVSLKNNGNEPVTITRAKASCGCTTSDFKNGTVLQPGESTDISVTMNGKGRARKMSKTVTFTIDGYPALRLPVVAETISYVSLDVDPIVMNEETGTTKVVLTSLDEQPFKVTSILPAIAELPTEASATQELLLDWDAFWDVARTTKITIRIDHPLCKEITTNVRLSAEQRQRLNKKITADRAGGELPTKDPSRPLTGDQLARYIKGGRGKKVLEYIDSGLGKFNATDKGGVSLLSIAAEAGDAETASGLLKLGAQLERVDRVNRTPIMYAARSKNPETLQVLLDAGADIQARDRLGNTPLSWAAGFGTADGVQVLIDAGSDANIVDTALGYTPLLWASGFGDSASVKILLEADADVNVVDLAEKRSPLMHAVRTGQLETVDLLLKAGANVNDIDKQNTTALHIGSGNSNVSFEKIKLLVEAGADVNAKDASGKKPVDLAKLRDDDAKPEVIAYLQERTTEE
jgi:ankyrin repeat protein